jgi:hypothetical protein
VVSAPIIRREGPKIPQSTDYPFLDRNDIGVSLDKPFVGQFEQIKGKKEFLCSPGFKSHFLSWLQASSVGCSCRQSVE